MRSATTADVMRYYDEEDPKKPAPVHQRRKGESALEASEHEPIEVGPKDGDEDHHAHVRC